MYNLKGIKKSREKCRLDKKKNKKNKKSSSATEYRDEFECHWLGYTSTAMWWMMEKQMKSKAKQENKAKRMRKNAFTQ